MGVFNNKFGMVGCTYERGHRIEFPDCGQVDFPVEIFLKMTLIFSYTCTYFEKYKIKEMLNCRLNSCKNHLLGVKANLCLHSSQNSFLLYFSHCTKLKIEVK